MTTHELDKPSKAFRKIAAGLNDAIALVRTASDPLVRTASDPTNPLRRFFEWNDSVAAEPMRKARVHDLPGRSTVQA